MGTSQLESSPGATSQKGQTLQLGKAIITLTPTVVGGVQALQLLRDTLIVQNRSLHQKLADLGLPHISHDDIPRCITVLAEEGDVALHEPTDALTPSDGRALVSEGFTLLRPAMPRCQGMLQLLVQKTLRIRMDELGVPEEYELSDDDITDSFLLRDRWEDRWGIGIIGLCRVETVHMESFGQTYLGAVWQYWRWRTGYDTLPMGAVYTGQPVSILKEPISGPEACYLDTTFAILAYYLGFGGDTMWNLGDTNQNRKVMTAELARAYGCYGHGFCMFAADVSPCFNVEPVGSEFRWGSACRTEEYHFLRPNPEYDSWSRRRDTEWGFDMCFVRPGSIFDSAYPGNPTKALNLVPFEHRRGY